MSDIERCRANSALARVTFACLRYQLRHGKLPASLEAVRSGLLKEMPSDPLGSGVLGYDPVRKILWSAGFNGVDDGGRSTGSTFITQEDIVWSVGPSPGPI